MQWEAPSKPLVVDSDDPLLLLEREVHAEIGINWFLDREIPKKGYVRILAQSLIWEKRLGKTRIRTSEGSLHKCSRTEGEQLCEQQLESLTKAMVRPRTRADHGHSRGN